MVDEAKNIDNLKKLVFVRCSYIQHFKEYAKREVSRIVAYLHKQGRENVYGRPDWSGPSFGSES